MARDEVLHSRPDCGVGGLLPDISCRNPQPPPKPPPSSTRGVASSPFSSSSLSPSELIVSVSGHWESLLITIGKSP
ncbi:hypothetical protein MLD38_014105 [Melastoma candidum]|uniref:Uncharacterized protein n=1 Tax=Melastoma candidum TaxID=119954 RepID=A0ACB9RCV7_9MYRT|nr:hypothetical protein MLD38_014105 [Melastoma candidum]